jgi:RHS repeat-associated protein
VYDSLTFRLVRQRSERFTKATAGQVTTYTVTAGTVRQDDAYQYDLIGNIMKLLTRVTDCGIVGSVLGKDALDRTFTYDSLNRLLSATGRESNTQNGNTYLYNDAPVPPTPTPNNVRAYTQNYVYDKLGNVISVVQPGTSGFTRNFVYNAGVNTLERINTATPTLIENYTYDANGNQLTAGSTRNYKWNYADQLLSYSNQVGTSSPTVFTQYDYAGQDRVSKMVRTGTAVAPIYERTIYIDGVFEYVRLETTSATSQKNYIHITDGSSRIAEIRVGTAFPGDIVDAIVYNLETNIGSSAVRLKTTGAVIDIEEYYPFGDSSLRTFTYKRYRYVGKERDGESGLYYYGARYYSAWTCRFISVDPLADKYPQLTPYNYADNNPINDYDIDGMQNNNTPEKPQNTSNGGKVGDVKTKGTELESKVNGTGNLLIIFKDEKDLTPDKYKISTKENENWDYVVVDKENFNKLDNWVSDYAAKYGKINNLAIRSHGGGRVTDYNHIDLGGGKLMTHDFNNYFSNKTKGDQQNMATLDVISNIAKELSNNATIIIGACGVGLDDGVMAGMSYLLNVPNTNREVLFNKSLTNRLNYMKLDTPLTEKNHFAGWGGWTKVNNKSFVVERNVNNKTKQSNFKQSFDVKQGKMEGNLILNSKGQKAFTFLYQNK